jgi:hypothetical protein
MKITTSSLQIVFFLEKNRIPLLVTLYQNLSICHMTHSIHFCVNNNLFYISEYSFLNFSLKLISRICIYQYLKKGKMFIPYQEKACISLFVCNRKTSSVILMSYKNIYHVWAPISIGNTESTRPTSSHLFHYTSHTTFRI